MCQEAVGEAERRAPPPSSGRGVRGGSAPWGAAHVKTWAPARGGSGPSVAAGVGSASPVSPGRVRVSAPRANAVCGQVCAGHLPVGSCGGRATLPPSQARGGSHEAPRLSSVSVGTAWSWEGTADMCQRRTGFQTDGRCTRWGIRGATLGGVPAASALGPRPARSPPLGLGAERLVRPSRSLSQHLDRSRAGAGVAAALGELCLRMSLGSPSVSLPGRGVGAGGAPPAAEASPPGRLLTFLQLLGPCSRPRALRWAPFSLPPAPLGRRKPVWSEGAGAGARGHPERPAPGSWAPGVPGLWGPVNASRLCTH